MAVAGLAILLLLAGAAAARWPDQSEQEMADSPQFTEPVPVRKKARPEQAAAALVETPACDGRRRKRAAQRLKWCRWLVQWSPRRRRPGAAIEPESAAGRSAVSAARRNGHRLQSERCLTASSRRAAGETG
jgi:hypothetical protein